MKSVTCFVPLVLLTLPVQGQPMPLGGEFQVNSYTPLTQRYPEVAIAPSGDFLVVWTGLSPLDTSGGAILGQRFAPDATPLSGELQVNTYTTSQQYYSNVAADGNGNFIVVWDSDGSSGSDTSGTSVQGQRFASDGTPTGSQFQVNTFTAANQNVPTVAANGAGAFVVAWISIGGSSGSDPSFASLAQRFAADGTPLGAEIQLNTYTTGSQFYPAVAMDDAGGFVAVWDSSGSSGSDNDSTSIQGQRFAADGTRIGGEFQVNSYTTSGQMLPAVAMDPGGGFVVVWQSGGSAGSDTDARSVQGRRFASDGTALGDDFQVNTYTTNSQDRPAVAVDGAGNFVVVWQGLSSGPDTDGSSILGQFFAAGGIPVGGEFQVNTYTPSAQRGADVAMDAGGDFVVTWSSYGSSGNDTSFDSIQAQRFRAPGDPVPELTIPSNVPSGAAESVTVPVQLDADGAAVAGVAFSVDYDAACLDFDATDADLDGVPDALASFVPPDFDLTVFFDLGDADGEIDVTVVDVTPPLASLADGVLVTLTFTATCTPATGASTVAPVVFSTDPAASFSDPLAQSIAGATADGSVEIFGGARGDCNGNETLDVADLVACGLEIFDGDGADAVDAAGGSFAGQTVGCDANADLVIDAGDISCNNRLLFGLPCAGGPSRLPSGGASPPRLAIPDALLPADGSVVVPVSFDPGGHAINAAVFSLDLEATRLAFDPADRDGDGVPDSVRFVGPSVSRRSVDYDPADAAGELDFTIADLVAEPRPLTASTLLEIELVVLGPQEVLEAAMAFSLEPSASFGDVEGRSVPGRTELLPVAIPLFHDGFETGDTTAWSAKRP